MQTLIGKAYRGFWAYLQGMETRQSYKEGGNDRVLSLPTRNGNRLFQAWKGLTLYSFEPTYKEWKLIYDNFCHPVKEMFWAYLQGMETHLSFFLNIQMPRFEPTYKEWKQTLPKSLIFCSFHVLSLPTRNGNGSRPSLLYGKRGVLSLPTRNGNRASIGPTPLSFSVLSLPTRNGNPEYKQEYGDIDIGFEPTYKEWKPLEMNGKNGNKEGFEPTYKEWKLASSP